MELDLKNEAQPVKKEIQTILDREAERAKRNEILIGIDPKSYLGKEIIFLSGKICELNISINALILEIGRLKKERQKPSCLKRMLLSIVNKVK